VTLTVTEVHPVLANVTLPLDFFTVTLKITAAVPETGCEDGVT